MIKNEFLKYKEISLAMLRAVEDEEMDLLITLLEDRQKVINNIQRLKYEKEEFDKVVKELGVLGIDSKLNSIMEEKRFQCKKALDELKVQKKAHDTYNKSFYNASYFLKEHI